MIRGFILASGILFALTLIFRDQSRFEKEEATRVPALSSSEHQLPEIHPKNHEKSWATEEEKPMATEVWEEQGEAAKEEAGAEMFLPQAKVVASVVASVIEEEAGGGSQRVIENVATSTKDKLVRVEKILQPISGGGTRVVSEAAMVANQLFLQKPSGMASYMFLDMLGRAGALRVEELDEGSYLATFRAEPENPLALDTYAAKVQELAGVDVAVEPNYISKAY
jgi:hypothetical protein